MPTTTEPVMALRYTYDTLHNDSVLRAQEDAGLLSVNVAPVDAGAPFPRIVIEAPTSGPDLNALQDGGPRIWGTPRVLISVISADESYDPIDPVAARVDTLLHGGGAIAVSGGLIVTYERDLAFTQTPLEENGYHAAIIQQYSTTVRAT